MAPKKQTTEEEPSNADLFRLMNSMNAKIDKIDKIDSEVKDIKTLVVSLREENKELRSALKQKDQELSDMQQTVNNLQEKLNNLEQHHRGWSARVLNIPTTPEEEADPSAMINKVFNFAILPILEGAVRIGKLKSIPAPDQIIEVAHVLPGKPGLPKPIILRFFSRNIRNLIFSLKKDFATREPDRRGAGVNLWTGGEGPGGGGVNREGANVDRRLGRYKYPLYDDLTKANLSKMKAISQDDRVLACWSVNGQIKYKLKKCEKVRKVISILDPLDQILE